MKKTINKWLAIWRQMRDLKGTGARESRPRIFTLDQANKVRLEPLPSSDYAKHVNELEDAVLKCMETSHSCAGIRAPTAAHFHASLLFTSLCTRAVSLIAVVPYNSWAEKRRFENWDFATAGGIVRSILEVRLAFFYLCIEKVNTVEWNCRWNVLNMHDCTARIHLFGDMADSAETIAGFQTQRAELEQRLVGNAYFQSLASGKRKQILNGQVAYLYPLEEIARNARIDVHEFRLLYKLLSSQMHAFPLSFYRMADQNRGRGVHSESEEGYTALCVEFANRLLFAARDEMETLFKISAVSPDVPPPLPS